MKDICLWQGDMNCRRCDVGIQETGDRWCVVYTDCRWDGAVTVVDTEVNKELVGAEDALAIEGNRGGGGGRGGKDMEIEWRVRCL
jgi:hypothetical protein